MLASMAHAWFATTAPVDIGLCVFDGRAKSAIGCEAPGPSGEPTSPLRIAKNGTTYGILLVDTEGRDASPIRVNTFVPW